MLVDQTCNKTAFVTVGTTSFDRLVTEATCLSTLVALKNQGFTTLILQHGKSIFNNVNDNSNSQLIKIESYSFQPSIDDDLLRADLVISHAGTGSILGALRAGRPLIVVVNEKLMNNHQEEIAEAMEEDGVLVWCRLTGDDEKNNAIKNGKQKMTLASVIEARRWQRLAKWTSGDPLLFTRDVESLAGY